MTSYANVEDLFRGHRSENSFVRWPLAETLTSAPEVAYRNRLAEALSLESPDKIASSYVYMSASAMQQLMKLVVNHMLSRPLAGYGIELGAGCGLLSAVVAKNPQVQGILALEVCENMARLVIPKISRRVLNRESLKVVPVIGSFDDIRLPDASLDFAIEIDSFHHSGNLEYTLCETARVLKSGGFLICLDRCHQNSVTDAAVEQMLNQVYSREFLIGNHYPPDAVLTRRQNGEHEYRRFEWERAFKASGFRIVKTFQFDKAISARVALKGLLSVLPAALRPGLRLYGNERPQTALLWLLQAWGRIASIIRGTGKILAPKATTAF
jgi:ubiquinone/menaquinone biosynthesis C-methylase UbiE